MLAARSEKIAIFLPQPYRGGSLRFARKLAEIALSVTASAGTEVVLSVVKDRYDLEQDFGALLANPRFSIRETVWLEVAADKVRSLGLVSAPIRRSEPEKWSYPDDGGHCFADCASWLMVSDRTDFPIIPRRPYAIFPLDFIQRYVPAIFDHANDWLWDVHLRSMQANLRNASLVVCTTPQTAADAISFGGVPKSRVRTIRPFIEDSGRSIDSDPGNRAAAGGSPDRCPYFVWVTNPWPHKNHITAIDALQHYYQVLGGTLECLVVGPDTEHMRAGGENFSPYAEQVENHLKAAFTGDRPVTILGELLESRYWQILASARFLFHDVLYDNGTYAVVEAALAGRPSLSSDYPQARYMDELFALGLSYFPAHDHVRTAEALMDMERKTKESFSRPPFTLPAGYDRAVAAEVGSVIAELRGAVPV